MIFCHLANDIRIPYTYLEGAFLNFGKLISAGPCPPRYCGLPAIQYSKTFVLHDMEWNDHYYDPGLVVTILAMDAISKRVLFIFDLQLLKFDALLFNPFS